MTAEQFWARVERGEGCWRWTGHTNRKGYGWLRWGRRNHLAHRVSWEIQNGPIPDGLCVLHRCDHPPCVNPDHLFLGTVQDNNADRDAKGRAGGGRLPGESHPMAKLSAGDVEEIRRASASGTSRRLLAERFGVSKNHVTDIVRRRKWR